MAGRKGEGERSLGGEMEAEKEERNGADLPTTGVGGGGPPTTNTTTATAQQQSNPNPVNHVGRRKRRRSHPFKNGLPGSFGQGQNKSQQSPGSGASSSNNGDHGSQARSSGGGNGNGEPSQNPFLSKRAKRVRRNHLKRASRSQLHIRRVIQAAPNNNNEYLMQEHDDMYHFEQQQPFHGQEDSEGNPSVGSGSDMYYGQSHSSPDEEEEYLARDFSNAYDVIHAERLNSMSKVELIQEYQLLEERVETLERKIRTPRHSLQQIQTQGGVCSFHQVTFKDPCCVECIPIKQLEEELCDLREENRKLRHENKILGTLRQMSTGEESVEESENAAE